jgi:hypothetical protein
MDPLIGALDEVIKLLLQADPTPTRAFAKTTLLGLLR